MIIPDLRLAMFDLDGTVADTLDLTFACFQAAVAPVLGRTPSREEILERFGPADHEIVSTWVGEAEAAAAVERLYACYEQALEDSAPIPGMVNLLEDLRGRGIKTALFTGRGRPSTDVILRVMHLETLFATTVTGDEVPRSKPAPDGIVAILRRLSVLPEHAVYVGDTIKDVESARAAGVLPLAALWRCPEPERFTRLTIPKADTVPELRALLLGEAL
jgi:HAD superfamily hydrolase (TIGR01549 family)